MKVKDDGHADFLTGKDKDGSTVLNCAAWKGHVAVLEHLLERGAAKELKNLNGPTAYEVTFDHNAAAFTRINKNAIKAPERIVTAAASVSRYGISRNSRQHLLPDRLEQWLSEENGFHTITHN